MNSVFITIAESKYNKYHIKYVTFKDGTRYRVSTLTVWNRLYDDYDDKLAIEVEVCGKFLLAEIEYDMIEDIVLVEV